MEEPGLDERERDENGRIRLKNGNTLNENLSRPISGFPPRTTVEGMREATGEKGLNKIREAAKKL